MERLSFKSEVKNNNIFSDMMKPITQNQAPKQVVQPQAQPQADSFVSQTKNQTNEKSKMPIFSQLKDKIKANKKLLIGAGIVGAAIVGAVVFKKRLPKSVTQPIMQPVKDQIQNTSAQLQDDGTGIAENLIKKAKTFLISDVENYGNSSVNGVCFYGPDSIGKENAINSFLNDLKEAGYEIEYAPRASEMPSRKIGSAITELRKKAEQRFTDLHKRTAIVVRDLDQIAVERRGTDLSQSGAVSALLEMQFCRKRGYTWISEAVDLQKVDMAVQRTGRMEHQIPVHPEISEPMELWQKYIDMINKFRPERRDVYLKEAKQLIEKKGI